MARTAEQIKSSMGSTVASADPSADLAKGPVADLLLYPVAPELATTEQAVEDLRLLASLQMANVITETEIKAIGTSFGLTQLTGRSARYRQTFWTSTAPASDLVIERGTLVGNSDASRTYAVIERVVMIASNATAYYNAPRRRYEITATVEATAIGTASNLPAYRIRRMITRLSGFDGTENRDAPTLLGTDRQSFAEYLARIQKKFAGLNPEAGAGISTQITEYAPETITDVNLVYPKDRDVFMRDTGRPAIDAYIIGSKSDTTNQKYVAIGGESSFKLLYAPVLSVSNVVVNDVAVTGFALIPDTDPSTADSARANDLLVLPSALTAGQVVDVSYSYNSLVRNLQNEVFDVNGSQFGTDILVRMPKELPITVHIDATILPSFDINRTTDSINTVVFDYVETNKFTTDLYPETLRQTILSSVAGTSSVSILKFTPTTSGTIPVESISIKKNQIPIVDQTNLSITTHQ